MNDYYKDYWLTKRMQKMNEREIIEQRRRFYRDYHGNRVFSDQYRSNPFTYTDQQGNQTFRGYIQTYWNEVGVDQGANTTRKVEDSKLDPHFFVIDIPVLNQND